MERELTDNLAFEIALHKARDLLSLEWTPATEADLDAMDPMVVELVRELRRGQAQRDKDRDSQPTEGRRIAGYDPSQDGRAPMEADATTP